MSEPLTEKEIQEIEQHLKKGTAWKFANVHNLEMLIKTIRSLQSNETLLKKQIADLEIENMRY